MGEQLFHVDIINKICNNKSVTSKAKKNIRKVVHFGYHNFGQGLSK